MKNPKKKKILDPKYAKKKKPKKKKILDPEYIKKKKQELADARQRAKDEGSVPIGFAIESAGKGETVTVMMNTSTDNLKVGNASIIAAGELVGMDSSGKVIPFKFPEKEDEDEKSDEEAPDCYGIVEVEDDFIRELLQIVCNDLLGKDVKAFYFDKIERVWRVVVLSNRSTATNLKGHLPVISRIHGSISKEITSEDSFRRSKKVKKKVSEGKAIGLKMNERKERGSLV